MKVVRWGQFVIAMLGIAFAVLLFAPVAAQSETATLRVEKRFCPVSLSDDPSCNVLAPDVVGREVGFVLTNLDTGDEIPFTILIVDGLEGELGARGQETITDLPLGNYELCETETVSGWRGVASPLFNDGQMVDRETDCLLLPVKPGENRAFFVNFPDPVDELPDTGGGMATPARDGSLTAVLLSGAMLALLAGLRFRPTHAR